MTTPAPAHASSKAASAGDDIVTDPQAESPFADEVRTMQWVLDEVRAGHVFPVIEAEAVVASLYIGQRESGQFTVPVVPIDDVTVYHAVHGINVAFLAMAMAEEIQFEAAAVRRVGLAALLHDVGMARVPQELVAKPGQITPEERERVKEHPVEGARILIAAGAIMDLPAIVAYEHHLKIDGSGYPKLTWPRSPHYVSRLVQVCDVFDALRSRRPYRPAWPAEIILSYLNERAGFEFHPALASALSSLVQRHGLTAG